MFRIIRKYIHLLRKGDRPLRLLFAAQLMLVMKQEFDDMSGEAQIAMLDDVHYDEWEVGLAYQSDAGVQVGISVFDDRLEIFVTARDLIHESYFSDDLGNAEEARLCLRQFIANVEGHLREEAV